MKTFETPILFLIFNRPDETKKVFERIKKIKPKFLYIAADGSRKDREGETELCERVKKVVEIIDWDCEIQRLYRKENLGCKEAVSKGIIWFFENVEQGIILEDDCLPDISFFTYCEELLNRYKDDDRIISIGGTNLGHKFRNKNSYSFSRFMNMWGWATWRRVAQKIDYNLNDWQLKS